MFIKNLSKRERHAALGTVAVILAAILYNFVIEPVFMRWKELNIIVEARMNTLKKDAKVISMHKTLESDYARVSKYVKSEKSDEESTAEMMTYIESVSRDDSCPIFNLKPMGIKTQGGYKELLIDLNSEASMEQFSKFLYDIENTKNAILRVKRFTISSKSGQDGILKGSFLINKIIIK